MSTTDNTSIIDYHQIGVLYQVFYTKLHAM